MKKGTRLIHDNQRQELLNYEFKENEHSKIFNNKFFGYTKLTIEQPLKDDEGNIVKDKKGNPKPDSKLRDYERVPLSDNIEDYFNREVKPHLPKSWINTDKTFCRI